MVGVPHKNRGGGRWSGRRRDLLARLALALGGLLQRVDVHEDLVQLHQLALERAGALEAPRRRVVGDGDLGAAVGLLGDLAGDVLHLLAHQLGLVVGDDLEVDHPLQQGVRLGAVDEQDLGDVALDRLLLLLDQELLEPGQEFLLGLEHGGRAQRVVAGVAGGHVTVEARDRDAVLVERRRRHVGQRADVLAGQAADHDGERDDVRDAVLHWNLLPLLLVAIRNWTAR